MIHTVCFKMTMRSKFGTHTSEAKPLNFLKTERNFIPYYCVYLLLIYI